MITSKCPFCSAEFEIEEELVGRRGQCYACGLKFEMQPASEVASAPVPAGAEESEPPLFATRETVAPLPPTPSPHPAAPPVARPVAPPAARHIPPARPAAATRIAKKKSSAGKMALVLLGLAGAAAATWMVIQQSRRAPSGPGADGAPRKILEPLRDGPLGPDVQALVAKGDFHDLSLRLQQALAGELSASDGHVLAAMNDPVKLTGITQAEIIRQCTPETLSDLLKKDQGREFLLEFFRSQEWMESFLVSEPPAESFGKAVENLHLLWRHGRDLDRHVYRRLATAMALSGGKMNSRRLVDRFLHVQEAHRALLLHAQFDRLDVREMRWAVYFNGNREDYQYLLDDRQTTIGGYFGSCWACWYLLNNDFGDSIHGPNYHLPWRHIWAGWECARQVGGVCGTLSTFGSMSARAHGVLSTPVGQPGHCAYVIRSNGEWPVAYSVTWPTGASVPGWAGTGYSTFHRLHEKVQYDREAYLRSNRLLWVARMVAEASRPRVRVLPGVKYAVYRKGVGAGLPDFSKLSPDTTGTVNRVRLSDLDTAPPANFGVVWEGELEVSGQGRITVATYSDDGSRVLINGEAIVSANCTRDAKSIELAPGRHPFRVEYCQGGGGFHHTLELEGALIRGDWTRAYERAALAQPLNYAIWLEYIQVLEKTDGVPTSVFSALATQLARTFSGYPEAGWGLINRILEKAGAEMEPARRLVLISDCHRDLTQAKADRFEAFPIDGVLNHQAGRLGDPKLEPRFFEQLLRIHHAPSPNDWIFGQVLAWGQNRFARNPATATAFASALGSFFRGQGEKLDEGRLREQVISGIRNAGESGDLPSFRLWNDMAESLLPALKPQEVHLNDEQAKTFPERAPFPGDVLSRDALLQVNKPSQHDRPLSYRALLRDSPFGGYFDTDGMDNPWVTVKLPGASEISGIVIVDRYENAAEAGWAVPLQVSVSEDGKTWTPVARFDTAQAVYRVNLGGKPAKAVQVKIERLPGKTDRFHLRNILIYGKRLY